MAMAEFDQIEYCYLAEDTDPDAMTMEVYIPKLQGDMSMGNGESNEGVNKSAVMNADGACVSEQCTCKKSITARVQDSYHHKHGHHDCPGNCPNISHSNTCGSTSKLAVCKHFHHDHHFPHRGDYGMIPAGAQMLCIIMNKNIKDIIVTRMWCRWGDEITPNQQAYDGVK